MKTVAFHQLPPWMQDNEYIRTRYRPASGSVRESLRTAFVYTHNETFNVYSHGLAAALFVLLTAVVLWHTTHVSNHHVVAEHDPMAHRDQTALDYELVRRNPKQWVHRHEAVSALLSEHQWRGFLPLCMSAVICLTGSALYHALWNVSSRVLRLFARIDYAGIVGLSIGHGMLGNHFAFYCRPSLVSLYNALILCLGIPVLIAIFHPRFEAPELRRLRAAIFVSFGLCNLIPIVHAGLLQGIFAIEFWRHAGFFVGTGVSYLVGAFIYATRWPEKRFPDGRFDCYFNSHNILHLAVVLACLLHFWGAVHNFHFRMQHGCTFDT